MWLIFKKEFMELVRDRKTLIFMIALPVLVFPLLIGGTIFFTSNALEDAENKVLKYAVIGNANVADINSALSEDGSMLERVTLTAEQDYVAMIQADELDFVLEVPTPFNSEVLESGQLAINLYFNDAGLNKVYQRVSAILTPLSEEYQLQAFRALGLSESQQQAIVTPMLINRENVADNREVWGERIGAMLPYFLFFLCLQGAMAPASDMGAGEKERGTLETLLISPMPRYKLVLGKFFAISLSGVIAALVTVSSMALWTVIISQGLAVGFIVELLSSIGVLDFVLVFLMLVPVVAVFASLLLSLSIYARSFKEAQSYMGGLVMVMIFPIILAMMPGIELKGVWVWVPLTNVALAMKELVKGTMDYVALLGIFGSTALIAGILLAFSVHWFNREKVLFR
ncbi:ABC transporter permease subunit [Alteromonas sp. ASW11-19]|uniref:ABC transporter permease subunit n=1 Tax=Alteromonas salexigens TaxID=2982530 RepID=A0ABT2VP48_9ALTE|nr:ABC transporter permease subunit [Alteromonas salexigens]MCU7554865.1 ABC transporter permease subunit [Alteromonas salexigens]